LPYVLTFHFDIPCYRFLYETCIFPMFASTLNSLSSLSTIISRCNSPMPAITVWPVSLSVPILKVGSSSAILFKARESLSWSAFVLGSIAIEITGSGKLIDSYFIGLVGVHIVSPVLIFFNPRLQQCHRYKLLRSPTRLFACISRILEILSLLSVVVLKYLGPHLKRTRINPYKA